MVFTSFAFLLGLLPASLAGYHWLRARGRSRAARLFLVAVSLAFYAWSAWRYLPLIGGSILINYAVARLVHTARHGAAWCAAGIAFNIGLLVYFKYAGFLLGAGGALLGFDAVARQVVLPLAISFFTFQQIAYLVETRRGAPPTDSLLDYALFVLFFPHLVAGPITHHSEMLPQFAAMGGRPVPVDRMLTGLAILVIGMAKKMLLADTLAMVADPVFDGAVSGEVGTGEAWLGALAYSFQLYFDFSGYSDMAIGLGLLFGIRFPVNFASPYKATSIVAFWSAWHITLSRFLRAYVYIPLGGNRHGTLRRMANLMATMALGGLWHGAGWTFLAWGLLHGLFLVINHGWRAMVGGRVLPGAALWGWALTFLAVVAGWVLFRAASMPAAGRVLAAMAGLQDGDVAALLPGHGIATALVAAAAGVALLLPNTLQFAGYPDGAPAFAVGRRSFMRPTLAAAGLGAVAALCFARLPNPGVFLYFNF